MRNDRENVIAEKSFKFALKIVAYCELLEENRKFIISRQLLKSGTSIGANVREAQNAESKADFIHKLKIAAKETDETEYWLLICKFSPSYPFDEKLLSDLAEINKLLSKILSTSIKNYKNNCN
jgi:four helix bundle protein